MSNLFNTLSTSEIYFGPQGFKVFDSQEDIQTLTEAFKKREEQPNWNDNWDVIALDTELGDPYVIDRTIINSAVYTAIFTGVEWELILVSDTVHSFVECLKELLRVHSQKEPQFVPDDSSFPNDESLTILTRQLIALSDCEEFWRNFSNCYVDWLEEE